MREMFITLILLMRTRDTRGTREVRQSVQVMQAARGRVKTQTKWSPPRAGSLPEPGPEPRNLSASLPPIAVDDRGSIHWHLPAPMAPHSSTLAWKIPWAEEPGRLQSMGSWRVEHTWVTWLWLFTFMHWGRKWQPTPVFLPGESQGQGSLVGCRLWDRTESDTTEVT